MDETREAAAFPFSGGDGWSIRYVDLMVGKSGIVLDHARVSVCADDGGQPGYVLRLATVDGIALAEEPGWVRFTLAAAQVLTAGTTYWISFDRSGADIRENWLLIRASNAGAHLESYPAGGWENGNGTLAYRLLNDGVGVVKSSEVNEKTITIGNLETVTSVAQGFELSSAVNAQELGAYVGSVGSVEDNLRLAIWSSVNGVPGVELVGVSIFGTLLVDSGGWVRLWIDETVLDANTPYFFMVTRSGGVGRDDYYRLWLDNRQGYAGGEVFRKFGGDWEDYQADMPFEIYDNTLIETSQQVKAIIGNFGQFLRRVVMETTSGQKSESYRDGDSTALFEVESLMKTGAGKNRLLAEVREDRTVRIFDKPGGSQVYNIRPDGYIYDWLRGMWWIAESCPVGFWVVPSFAWTGE